MPDHGSLLPSQCEKKRQREVLPSCTNQGTTVEAAPVSNAPRLECRLSVGTVYIHTKTCSLQEASSHSVPPVAPTALLQLSASARPASPLAPVRGHNMLLMNGHADKTSVRKLPGPSAVSTECRGRGRPFKTGHVHDRHSPRRFTIQIDVVENQNLLVLPEGVQEFFKGVVPRTIQLRTSPHCHWDVRLTRYEDKLVLYDVEAEDLQRNQLNAEEVQLP
jgi:hypothetical protein